MLPNCPQYLIAVVRRPAARRHRRQHQSRLHARPRSSTVARDSGHPDADHARPAGPASRRRCDRSTNLEAIVITSLSEYSPRGGAAGRGRRHASPRRSARRRRGRRSAARHHRSRTMTSRSCNTPAAPPASPKAAMLTHRNIFANTCRPNSGTTAASERGHERFLMVIPVLPHLRPHGRHDAGHLAGRAADPDSEIRRRAWCSPRCATTSRPTSPRCRRSSCRC